jgi:hypothetical protein
MNQPRRIYHVGQQLMLPANHDGCLREPLGCGWVAEPLPEKGAKEVSKRKRDGMAKLPRERDALIRLRESLLRMAKRPKRQRSVDATADPGIVAAIAEDVELMSVGIVSADAFLCMAPALCELALIQPSRPGRVVRLQQLLGQASLICKLEELEGEAALLGRPGVNQALG